MRLDQKLVILGIAPSRSRAQDLIKRGFVRVDGAVCDKPSLDIGSREIELSSGAPKFVSRGAEKLLCALDHFEFDARDRIALDLGASTGGFTEVLLGHGAKRVYAVDVGTDQLHPTLREHPNVVSLETRDARELTADLIPEKVSAIVADLSFISVTKAIDPALALAADDAWLIILVKPQFEVGRDNIGSGGIVRDPDRRAAAVDSVASWLQSKSGWTVCGSTVSPILGGSGNVEYLLGARRDG